MNSIIKKWFTIIPLLVALALVSCSKDDPVKDITKPTAVISNPVEGSIFQRGASIILDATFMDDHMLASCDVSIVSLKALKGFDDPWMPNVDVIILEGEEDEVTAHQVFKQAIPMDIMSGEYSLTFKVVDEAGNYTDYPVNITIE